MDPTIILLAVAIAFAAGAAWHWWFSRESTRYRVPVRERVVTVMAAHHPRPGTVCQNFHGLVPPGCRCRVCGYRQGQKQT